MATTAKPAGRPTRYRAEFKKLAYRFALLGATDDEIAAGLEVVVSTLQLWKLKHPAFSDSIKKGKDQADAQVAEKLYMRATGYSHPDVHITQFEGKPVITKIVKHYPPESVACIFWLKNRQPKIWRDVQKHEVTGKDGQAIHVEHWTAEQIRDRLIKDGIMDGAGRLILEKN